MNKKRLIYAIKVSELFTTDLKIINVKIGQTVDIDSTLRQYKRSNPNAEILSLWEINPFLKSFYECEKGVHMLAEKYAYQRKRETFIFLQESYQNFEKNLSLLLKSINLNIKNKTEKRDIKEKKLDYSKKSLIQ